MNELRAILVDDEEGARDVLENLLLRFCPEVNILEKCKNMEQAVKAIEEHAPNIVFLDIEMPNYAGYEIVKFFEEITFEIIFVTAYDKYAVRAFEISAIDYLLKPIDIDRLKAAVSKVKTSLDLKNQLGRLALFSETLKTNELKSILVFDKGFQQLIALKDIIAIEANESYSIIHTVDGRFTASKNLKFYETNFSENSNFFRTHKSWIINLNYLVNFSKSELLINLETGLIAKLSKYKKAEFEAELINRS